MRPPHRTETAPDARVRWSPYDEWESPWALEECSVGRDFDPRPGQEKTPAFDDARGGAGARALTGAVLEFEPPEKETPPAEAEPPPSRKVEKPGRVEKPPPKTAAEPVVPRAGRAEEARPEELFKPVPVPEARAPREKTAARGRARAPREHPSTAWGTLFSLGLGALGFVMLVWLYWQDAPPESDEDLHPGLPADQTPVIHSPVKLRAFLDSVPRVRDPRLRELPPWEWDTPSLAEHARSGGTALDNLRDLLEDADWHPLHSGWCLVDHSSHEAWPDVIFLLQSHAAYLARRGHELDAFTAALDLAELSRRVLELWAWPAYARRAQDMGLGAAQSLAVLLKSTRLDEPSLAELQEQYTRCRPETELMRGYCAAFYLHQKKSLLGARSGEPLDMLPGGVLAPRPGRFFFKVHETLALFAQACREARDAVSGPAYAPRGGAPAAEAAGKPLFYHPNSAGAAWFQERAALLREMPARHHLAQARHGLVLTLFALRRHGLEHGAPPATLAELSPRWLEKELSDPFSGDAYRHEPGEGLLGSVGTDFRPGEMRRGAVPLSDDLEPCVETGLKSAGQPPD